MRLTDNERDLMEDLLSPADIPSQDEPPNQKRKHDDVQIALSQEDFYSTEAMFQQMMSATTATKQSHGLSAGLLNNIKLETQGEVYSSGLSPAAEETEEEEGTIHRGFVVYDYNALSVDDFFDLDEAST
jgi:hypothetical protein